MYQNSFKATGKIIGSKKLRQGKTRITMLIKRGERESILYVEIPEELAKTCRYRSYATVTGYAVGATEKDSHGKPMHAVWYKAETAISTKTRLEEVFGVSGGPRFTPAFEECMSGEVVDYKASGKWEEYTILSMTPNGHTDVYVRRRKEEKTFPIGTKVCMICDIPSKKPDAGRYQRESILFISEMTALPEEAAS